MQEPSNDNISEQKILEKSNEDTVEKKRCEDKNDCECKESSEQNLQERKSSEISLLGERVPRNVQSLTTPISRELEDVCAQVLALVHSLPDKQGNHFRYPFLVVKVMELVEEYKNLTGKERKLVATRCILELIDEQKELDDETKQDLMMAVPGSIEAFISMTKGEKLNREVTSAGVVEAAYVTRRAFERLIQYIRDHNFEIADIMANIFVLVSKLMFIVGGYPSLAGEQKKDIVVEVLTKLLKEFASTETGQKIPEHFITSTLNALPEMIDMLVNAAKGKFNINKLTQCCFPLFRKCCKKGCCKKGCCKKGCCKK